MSSGGEGEDNYPGMAAAASILASAAASGKTRGSDTASENSARKGIGAADTVTRESKIDKTLFLGFCSIFLPPIISHSTFSWHDSIFYSFEDENRWQSMYERLKLYKEKHGRSNVRLTFRFCADLGWLVQPEYIHFIRLFLTLHVFPCFLTWISGNCLVPNRYAEDTALGSWGKFVTVTRRKEVLYFKSKPKLLLMRNQLRSAHESSSLKYLFYFVYCLDNSLCAKTSV